MDTLKGQLLVASPHLEDPNFVHTVILLIHHSEEGAFGVVLNRPAENSIRELWEQVAEGPCEAEGHIHVGGPVSGPLIALHTDETLAEMEILPGVYFAAQRDNLEQLVSQSQHAFRLFVGHSGWGGGQLEHELEEGSWLTTNASAEYVFFDETDLWKTVTKRIGDTLLLDALGIKRPPPDPSVN